MVTETGMELVGVCTDHARGGLSVAIFHGIPIVLGIMGCLGGFTVVATLAHEWLWT